MNTSAVDKLASLLVVVGGLNWGLVGFFKYNLVEEVFGAGEGVTRVVYCVVGVAALWMLYGMVTMMAGSNKK